MFTPDEGNDGSTFRAVDYVAFVISILYILLVVGLLALLCFMKCFRRRSPIPDPETELSTELSAMEDATLNQNWVNRKIIWPRDADLSMRDEEAWMQARPGRRFLLA